MTWPSSPVCSQYIEIQGQPFLAYPTANSYEHVTEVIYSSLEDPQCVCILQNMLASPGDPWLKRKIPRGNTRARGLSHPD